MIKITDTEYQEKELKSLLESAEKTLDTKGVFAVKDAYIKGLNRGHLQIEHLIEQNVIDGLEITQASIMALRSYISDETDIVSEKAVDYILWGAIEQLEEVIKTLGYKGVKE